MKLPRPSALSLAARRQLANASSVGSALICSVVLVACGGGDGSSVTKAASTTVSGFSAGTVTGKGSTIVNGVRFDDSGADVVGDDDSRHGGDDVKVGMQVEVEFDDSTCTAVAAPAPASGASAADPGVTTPTPGCKASKIHFGDNSLLGPVAGFTAATATTPGSFTVLSQKIETNSATTVSLDGKAAALGNGVIVEVYGRFDATTGVTTATRIEVKAADLASLAAGRFFRLRGLLKVTESTVGGVKVDLSGVDTTGLDGKVVRVRLTPAAAEPFVVSKIKSTQRRLEGRHGARGELEGVIADWVYAADSKSATFTINGIKVSAAVSTDPGSSLTVVMLADLAAAMSATPAVPVRVEVHGAVDATGVFVASRLSLHDESNDASVELHGAITSVDATARSFVLRGETVQVTDTTQFKQSGKATISESSLAAGLKVEVEGRRSADGTALVATRIKLDN
jgi:hypothetical protein